MKTADSIKKQNSVLSSEDKKNLLNLIEDIQKLIQDNQINEDALRTLDNTITSLSALKNNYMWRIIRAAKQNHMLD